MSIKMIALAAATVAATASIAQADNYFSFGEVLANSSALDLGTVRAAGDGVRAFIVASHQGLLSSETVHQSTAQMNVDSLDVSTGDTIDFVVDIGDVLNSDEHLWTKTIEVLASTGDAASVWNSELDFLRNGSRQIDPWEQLAQVLFCTNEFMFVD